MEMFHLGKTQILQLPDNSLSCSSVTSALPVVAAISFKKFLSEFNGFVQAVVFIVD